MLCLCSLPAQHTRRLAETASAAERGYSKLQTPEEERKERARRGKHGVAGFGGKTHRLISELLWWEPVPDCYAPPFFSQLSVIISISPRASLPPPPCFLCSPSLPRACSPPPLLSALGSGNLGSLGDGKRARGALHLWSRRSFLLRCPEPPPPLSPPGYPPIPATRLGQSRHHRQPSSRPRLSALTRPGWSFPLLGSI